MLRLKKIILQFISLLDLLYPIAWLCAKATKLVSVEVKNSYTGNIVRVLALNPARFRGDLEILAATGEFEVYRAPFEWQGRFIRIFYRTTLNLCNKDKAPEVIRDQKALRSFLRNFLKVFYRILKIDIVIGAGVLYKQDFDWGAVSHEIGVPYIVLHRECFYASERLVKDLKEKFSLYEKFKGTLIFVHNEIVKKTWCDAGFVDLDQIASLGNMRMDKLVKRLKLNTPTELIRRPRVVLFSFGPGVALHSFIGRMWPKDKTLGFVNIFKLTHLTIAKLALNNRDVDFAIKVKWGGKWVRFIDELFDEAGFSKRKIPNLSILEDVDVHELIQDSSVIVGFCSTTILESAVIGKKVIVPDFAESLDKNLSEYVLMKDDYDAFEVANSVEDLEIKILEAVEKPYVSEEKKKKSEMLFEKYISNLEGNATQLYCQKMKQILPQMNLDAA